MDGLSDGLPELTFVTLQLVSQHGGWESLSPWLASASRWNLAFGYDAREDCFRAASATCGPKYGIV